MTQDTFTYYVPKSRNTMYLDEQLYNLQYGEIPDIKLNNWYRFKRHIKSVMV